MAVSYLNSFFEAFNSHGSGVLCSAAAALDFQRTMVQVKVQLIGDGYKDLVQEKKETFHQRRIKDLQAQIMVCKDWSEHVALLCDVVLASENDQPSPQAIEAKMLDHFIHQLSKEP